MKSRNLSLKYHAIGWLICGTLLVAFGCRPSATLPTPAKVQFSEEQVEGAAPQGYRGRVVDPSQISESALQSMKEQGWNHVVLVLEDLQKPEHFESIKAACRLIEAAGMDVEYFLEIARCPKLADEHPEWMASLQGHDEWRRLHPEFPTTDGDSVAKTYPWVPLYYAEASEAQNERVKNLLSKVPAPQRVWLNDVQGAPSACGCGHPLCRWTGDYGPIKTGHPLGENAPADFLGRLGLQFPSITFIPIWTTECEEADEHEACGGVGCYEGICWKSWTRQTSVVAERVPVIGVSCFYKAHERDLVRYGEEASWIKLAIEFFQSVPAKMKAPAIPPSRLIAVLQGWDVSETEIAAQLKQASAGQVRGVLLVETVVDQSWTPKLHKISNSKGRPGMIP